MTAVAFSPDGQLLATTGYDKTVRLWNPTTGTPIGEPLTGHTDAVLAVTFSPDGHLLTTTSDDETVRLWDPTTGEPLTGHTDAVLAVAFSPDGQLLATTSHDETVRLWQVERSTDQLLIELAALRRQRDALATQLQSVRDAAPLPDERAERRMEPWEDPGLDRALRAAISDSMSPASIGLYARWWQLESWLRELAYLELRAAYGHKWVNEVRAATGPQTQDAVFVHMTSIDNDNPLAYLDYSQLLEVMRHHWDLFGYALIEQQSWEGRQHELKRVRHRIGQLRRPHHDDLERLEQTLRDLERGAFIAFASYNRRRKPKSATHTDPVTNG